MEEDLVILVVVVRERHVFVSSETIGVGVAEPSASGTTIQVSLTRWRSSSGTVGTGA